MDGSSTLTTWSSTPHSTVTVSDLCGSLRFPQHQEKRVEDAIRSVRQQYEDVLERKQEEYVEKYKHLQYIEVSWSAVVIT